MKKIFGAVVLSAVLAAFLSTPVWAGEYIYKSKNKIDFVKIDRAKRSEREGGLNQPRTFTMDQMRQILGSIHFNKKILLLKDIQNRDLFDDENIEFLAPYIVEAFQKAKDDQAVIVSYFTRDSKFVIQNDRLTIMRAFVKPDGLHIKFTKLYAKMLGDRTTQGAAAASSRARGLRVSLELQEGQNRVAWDPEEIVFDLNHYTGGAVAAETPSQKEKTKKTKKGKEIVADRAVKQSAAASDDSGEKSVKDRLRELEDLKRDALITDKEYKAKRKELLKEL